jgi:hypothetical protein
MASKADSTFEEHDGQRRNNIVQIVPLRLLSSQQFPDDVVQLHDDVQQSRV